MEKVSLYLSTAATVVIFGWSIYAQATHTDFKMDDSMKTVILAPYMRAMYRFGRDRWVEYLKKGRSDGNE